MSAPATTSSNGTAPEAPAIDSLAGLRSNAQEQYGDYQLDLAGDGSDVIVLRHPLRLDPDVRKRISNIGTRITEAQADPPEVEAARKKLNAALNRLETVRSRREQDPDKHTASVVEEHEARVEQERAKVAAAIDEHVDEHAGLAKVRGVVHDMIRETAEDKNAAERLVTALGLDITMHIALVRAYSKRTQMGEASPSAS